MWLGHDLELNVVILLIGDDLIVLLDAPRTFSAVLMRWTLGDVVEICVRSSPR